MIRFINKWKDLNIYAPTSGTCIDITKVKDKTFSSKVIGDGFAIIPTSKDIFSPANGRITMLYPTLHAFGIEMYDGKNLLIHVGIDTVNLNGYGFSCSKKLEIK